MKTLEATTSTRTITVVDRVMNEQDDVILVIFSFLDVTTLCYIKAVRRHWSQCLIPRAILYKLPSTGQKPFENYKDLIRMVRKYCTNKILYAEEIARSYGWPIGKWDVSRVTQFVFIFLYMKDFNEDISEWDVSNATTMHGMFSHALSFNQDLSKWNTSNVKSMTECFYHARSFNGDITTWDVSKVERATNMFRFATSFDQDLCKHWPGMTKDNLLKWKHDEHSYNFVSAVEVIQTWPTSLRI